MTTYNHTAIATGAAANAATFNTPLGQLDAAIGSLTSLYTITKTSIVSSINELYGGAAGTSFTIYNAASPTIGASSALVLRNGDGYGYLRWSGSHLYTGNDVTLPALRSASTTASAVRTVFSACSIITACGTEYGNIGDGGQIALGITDGTGSPRAVGYLRYTWANSACANWRPTISLVPNSVGGSTAALQLSSASAAGSPMIGFYGSSPVAQTSHITYTDGGATAASDVVNLVLNLLESVGLMAAS